MKSGDLCDSQRGCLWPCKRCWSKAVCRISPRRAKLPAVADGDVQSVKSVLELSDVCRRLPVAVLTTVSKAVYPIIP